jgi:hypothetical protein
MDCDKVDTSGMDKIDCQDCENMSLRYALIASIPEREQMLQKTVESLRPQVDKVYVTLNGYDHIPDFLTGCEVIQLDNSKGDAGKFYFAERLKGYIFTCDDDLIYPPDYVQFMINGLYRYPECAVTLHGRKYSRPIQGFQRAFEGFPCLGDVKEDIAVDVGGDGVMCWHTDDLKIKFDDFKQKNMSQLYFSKLCKEQSVPIIVLAHKTGYLGYQNPAWTIWDESSKEGFVKQTELLKTFLR